MGQKVSTSSQPGTQRFSSLKDNPNRKTEDAEKKLDQANFTDAKISPASEKAAVKLTTAVNKEEANLPTTEVKAEKVGKEKSEKAEKAEKSEKEKIEKAEKEKSEKAEKAEKAEKTEKLEKVGKSDKVENVEKLEKIEKIEKAEKADNKESSSAPVAASEPTPITQIK